MPVGLLLAGTLHTPAPSQLSFPDQAPAAGRSVDPFEPNRVWFTIRTTGTHKGPIKFGRATYEATGANIQGPPECCSYTFNEVCCGAAHQPASTGCAACRGA